MFSYDNEFRATEQRKQNLLREAKLNHLAREAQRDQSKMHERFMTLLADLMISGGSRLKERYNNASRSLAHRTTYEITAQNL